MTDDIESRILQLFEVRLKREPEVSANTIDALVEDGRDSDFGDDDELLESIVGLGDR